MKMRDINVFIVYFIYLQYVHLTGTNKTWQSDIVERVRLYIKPHAHHDQRRKSPHMSSQ